MKRRTFIAGLSCSATWPLLARAQQPARLPTIGFLGAASPEVASQWVLAFAKRLRELGWVEGRTVAIEYRWAEAHTERYSEIAAELVRLKVDVIVTWASAPVLAAKQATAIIPIVFAAMGEVLATAHGLGLEVTPIEIRQADEIAPAIEALRDRVDALYVASDPLIFSRRIQINALAQGERLPTIYGNREYVDAGALMSYGPNWADLFRHAAGQVDKILRGAKPADIPVEQPTKFDLIVNMKTAKALGLDVPPTLLARADEVIE